MPTKMSAVPGEVFQLKVTLLDTMPPIWRRLLVPADLTLEQLHAVLQVTMGWQNCHLHEFTAGERHIGQPDPYDGMGTTEVEDERKVRLSGLLDKVGARLDYTYDMGDGWEHEIVLEKRLPADPGTSSPVCTGGELACPPEDCGGIGGFYNLLDAIRDPAHEEHEELLEWVGEAYDPEVFSLEAVNRLIRPRPTRAKKGRRKTRRVN